MSRYYTDFSEYTTGNIPSDWTVESQSGGTLEVIDDSSSPGGKSLSFSTGGLNEEYFLTKDLFDNADVEILARYEGEGVSNLQNFEVQVRSSTDRSTRYFTETTSSQFDVKKEVNGTVNTIGSVSKSFTGTDPPVYVRLRVIGDSVKGKAWLARNSEPESWDVDATDTDITSSGEVGIYARTNDNYKRYDEVAIGTNGDRAAKLPSVNQYDFKKNLKTSDLNNSNSTLTIPQPVTLAGNDYTGIDGYESGSSQLGWENETGFSTGADFLVYGSTSVNISSSNETVSATKTLSSFISSDNKRFLNSIRLNSQTGNSNDNYDFQLLNGDGQGVTQIRFNGDGTVDANDGGTLTQVSTWSVDTIYDIEVVLDFTNGQYDVVINGSTVATGYGFRNSASEIAQVLQENDTRFSGNTVGVYTDRTTYTSEVENSVNTGGFIGYDSSIVSGPKDIAFFDGSSNIQAYEIENDADVGSSSEFVTVWLTASRTRDNTVQDVFVYGNNTENVDRQYAPDVWQDAGALHIQHHEDTTGSDSSGNNDAESVTNVENTSGIFDGAGLYNDSDSAIELPALNTDSDLTVIGFVRLNESNASSFDSWFSGDNDNSQTGSFQLDYNNGDLRGIGGTFLTADSNWHMLAFSWDKSAGDASHYTDGSSAFTSQPSSVQTHTNPAIGRNRGGDRHWPGEIDELQVYQSTTTAAEIQALWDSSSLGNRTLFEQEAAVATLKTVSVSESLSLTDSVSKFSDLFRTISENVSINDSDIKNLSRAFSESLSFSDSPTSNIITFQPVKDSNGNIITSGGGITRSEQ